MDTLVPHHCSILLCVPFVTAENLSLVFAFLILWSSSALSLIALTYSLFSRFLLCPLLSWTFPHVKGLSTEGGFLLAIILKTEGEIDCETIFPNIFEDIVKIDNVIIHFGPVLFYIALFHPYLHLRAKGKNYIFWRRLFSPHSVFH